MLMHPCHRFFFAVIPPIALRRQIANAALWFDGGRGAVTPELMHVTAFILNDSDGRDHGLIERLRVVGGRLRAAPFEMTMDQVIGGAHSIALRPRTQNRGFAALHRQLSLLAGEAGLAERNDHRASPHLTLGYREGRGFAEPVAPVTWQVDEVALVCSHVGRTRHELLARWPLTGVADPDQLALF